MLPAWSLPSSCLPTSLLQGQIDTVTDTHISLPTILLHSTVNGHTTLGGSRNLHLLTATVWQARNCAPSLDGDHVGGVACLIADTTVQYLSLFTHVDSKYCNPPLPHKWTSPPAALSLETPARWSFSTSFHLLPSCLKSPSVLFSPSVSHYLLIVIPPPSLSLFLARTLLISIALVVSISLAGVVHWELVIVCGWKQRRRVGQITAMQSNQTTSQHSSMLCLYVQFVYIFKWTLFSRALVFVCESVYTFPAPRHWCKRCVHLCVCVWKMTSSTTTICHGPTPKPLQLCTMTFKQISFHWHQTLPYCAFWILYPACLCREEYVFTRRDTHTHTHIQKGSALTQLWLNLSSKMAAF